VATGRSAGRAKGRGSRSGRCSGSPHGPEWRPVRCRCCARLVLRRLGRLRWGHPPWCLRGVGPPWCLRGVGGVAPWCLRSVGGATPWRLRGFGGVTPRCLRGFGGVTPRCLRGYGGLAPRGLWGLRPGCDHGRPATGVLRLTPGPTWNAGPGMTVARVSLLGPAAAILLRRCSDQRSGRVKRRELGRLRRGIAAVAEREPGQLPRGIAAAAAGEQLDQDCQRANDDRRYPRDPHGYEAGHPAFGRPCHDEAAGWNLGG